MCRVRCYHVLKLSRLQTDVTFLLLLSMFPTIWKKMYTGSHYETASGDSCQHSGIAANLKYTWGWITKQVIWFPVRYFSQSWRPKRHDKSTVNTCIHVQVSNQRTCRSSEPLKRLNPVIWQTGFVRSVLRRKKGFREAVFRDHILLNHHLNKCQLSNGVDPSVWVHTREDFPIKNEATSRAGNTIYSRTLPEPWMWVCSVRTMRKTSRQKCIVVLSLF
jgi:hypothetical protein